MQIMSRKEIRKMSYYTRLIHYEEEKRDITTDPSLTQYEIIKALESLREKWCI